MTIGVALAGIKFRISGGARLRRPLPPHYPLRPEQTDIPLPQPMVHIRERAIPATFAGPARAPRQAAGPVIPAPAVSRRENLR